MFILNFNNHKGANHVFIFTQYDINSMDPSLLPLHVDNKINI